MRNPNVNNKRYAVALFLLFSCFHSLGAQEKSGTANSGDSEGEPTRVLLVSGAPDWEFRNLAKLLTRDTEIIVSLWLQTLDKSRAQGGNVSIEKLPQTADEFAGYDVIILNDPNVTEFGDTWLDRLQTFCERGGGVCYLSGPQYTASIADDERYIALTKMLPVQLKKETEKTGDSKQLPGKLETAIEIARNSVLDLADDDASDNTQIWNRLPRFYWSFPAKVRKDSTSKTLLRRADATDEYAALMVAGKFGEGRTLFHGINCSWRWRSVGANAEYYDRFWRKAVGYLAAKNGK